MRPTTRAVVRGGMLHSLADSLDKLGALGIIQCGVQIEDHVGHVVGEGDFFFGLGIDVCMDGFTIHLCCSEHRQQIVPALRLLLTLGLVLGLQGLANLTGLGLLICCELKPLQHPGKLPTMAKPTGVRSGLRPQGDQRTQTEKPNGEESLSNSDHDSAPRHRDGVGSRDNPLGALFM
jgi:hypothetical protein